MTPFPAPGREQQELSVPAPGALCTPSLSSTTFCPFHFFFNKLAFQWNQQGLDAAAPLWQRRSHPQAAHPRLCKGNSSTSFYLGCDFPEANTLCANLNPAQASLCSAVNGSGSLGFTLHRPPTYGNLKLPKCI